MLISLRNRNKTIGTKNSDGTESLKEKLESADLAIWGTQDWRLLNRVTINERVSDVTFSASGKFIVVVGSHTIQVIPVVSRGSSSPSQETAPLYHADGRIRAVAKAPGVIAAVCDDGSLELFSIPPNWD
jgi:hypothetical protein